MQQLCWHYEINTLRQWRKSLIVWAEIYDFITKKKANLHWAKSQIKLTSSDLRKCKDILTVLVFMEIEKEKLSVEYTHLISLLYVVFPRCRRMDHKENGHSSLVHWLSLNRPTSSDSLQLDCSTRQNKQQPIKKRKQGTVFLKPKWGQGLCLGWLQNYFSSTINHCPPSSVVFLSWVLWAKFHIFCLPSTYIWQ